MLARTVPKSHYMFYQIEGLYHIPRSVPVEKQNWGERRGNPGGCDIMGFGFLGPPTAPAVGAAPFHKMSASMGGVKEEKRIALESMIFWR